MVAGGRAYLLGGLGESFTTVTACDVYDFDTGEWSEIPPPPLGLVSLQVAAIGDRIYAGCGGTMDGQKFTEDRSLAVWEEGKGWRVVAELPFPVRHLRMFALRDRLLFYAAHDADEGGAVVRMFKPDPSVCVVEAATHR